MRTELVGNLMGPARTRSRHPSFLSADLGLMRRASPIGADSFRRSRKTWATRCATCRVVVLPRSTLRKLRLGRVWLCSPATPRWSSRWGSPCVYGRRLALINQVLDEVSAEQEGEFDEDTRWAIAWYAENGMDVGATGVRMT